MITISTEYYRNLYRIQQDHNLPSLAVLLPSTENIYELDLNSRKIEAPEFLGTDTEHAAEVIYFKCDRFFDYMDLASCAIIIQYRVDTGELDPKTRKRIYKYGIYAVPFVDVATCSLENKMLIPWCVDGNVTAQAGEVTFSIRFYRIDENAERVQYSLTSLPATSKVLDTIDALRDGADQPGEVAEQFVFEPSALEQVLFRLSELEKHNDLEWIVLN